MRRGADARGRRPTRPARGHRRRRRQRRRARHRAGGPCHRAGPDAGGDGHVDVPRDERRPPCRGPRDVRRGRGRHHAAAFRATRPARAASATSSRWFVEHQLPARLRTTTPPRRGLDPHEYLSELAAAQAPGEHGLVALDWLNGNRSVLVDHELSGVIVGLDARARGPRTSTARSSRRPHSARARSSRRSSAAGVPVESSRSRAGCVQNAFLMQIYADVAAPPPPRRRAPTRRRRSARRSTPRSRPGCHRDMHAAVEAMGRVRRDGFVPTPTRRDPTTSCSTTTPRCTTTSGGGAA